MLKGMKILKLGFLYYLLVFAAGFVLGACRVIFIVPILGVRWAELLELPLILSVSYLSAKFLISRFEIGSNFFNRLKMGVIALAFLLFTEFTFVLKVQGITLQQYFVSRDPVSSGAYFISLIIFALIPALLLCKSKDIKRVNS